MTDAYTTFIQALDNGTDPYQVADNIASHLIKKRYRNEASIFSNMRMSYPVPEQAKKAIREYVEMLRTQSIGGKRRKTIRRKLSRRVRKTGRRRVRN